MGNKKGRGKSAKGARKNMIAESEVFSKAPHTFVINRTKIGKGSMELLRNMRKVMEPYTASDLKVRKANKLREFAEIAGPLKVTHMLSFTQTDLSLYLKIIKFAKGPTLSFKVDKFSLAKDVVSSQRRPISYSMLFMHHPLLVLKDFPNELSHIQLMSSMFQNMFPSINVNIVKLNDVRRCVLFNYIKETGQVEFRHYVIKAVPSGISKPVKKLIKKVPDLSKYSEISEFLENPGYLSESEAELDNEDKVVLPQPIATRGVISGEKVALRLKELGPRMTLSLIKIESELCDGDVLYHNRFERTEEEIKILKTKRKKNEKRKQQIKTQQEINRKRNLKAAKKGKESDSYLENDNESNSDDEESNVSKKRKRNDGDDEDEDSMANKKKKIATKNEEGEEKKLVSFTKPKPKGQLLRRRKQNISSEESKKQPKQFKNKTSNKTAVQPKTLEEELLRQKKYKLKRQKLKDKKLKKRSK